MTTAIVIPAFNEADSIAQVVVAVSAYGIPVVVDDGSSDGTGARASAAGAVVVRQEPNRGYDAALARGFDQADLLGASFIVSADADGQLDSASIPVIIDHLRQNIPMVIGLRSTGAARWSESLFNRYTRMRFGVPDILCGMKGFRVETFRRHRAAMGTASVYTALALAALRSHEQFATVPVAVKPRPGASRFGGAWKANWKIARALAQALKDDLSGR